MDQREDLVEKTLKALGRAEVPEGLEARVAARLAESARGAEFRWRDVVAGSAVGGVWWRGAVCGVAVSMLVVGVVIGVGHFGRVSGHGGEAVARGVAAPVAAKDGAVVRVAARDCAGPEMLRASDGGSAQRHDGVRVGIVAGSQVMTGPPLTAEERGLVRLAKVGDLKELASLNPEVREKLEAEEAAQFRSFFAEPVKPVAVDPAAASTAPTVETVSPVAVEPSAVQPAAEPAAEPIAEPATESVTETTSGENE